MEQRLGTAEWTDPALVENDFAYRDGTVWIGRGATNKPVGYGDDRHVCLVCGNRGGKGTSVLINNICLWPGSLVVIDPKGENATVTAARRGGGSGEFCMGMGQRVLVVDPFREAKVPDEYRARFNPLDALDPNGRKTIDNAAMLADSIVLVNEAATDPFWDRRGREMVKALILHIVTAPEFEGRRNLLTLRRLILSGYQEGVEELEKMGDEAAPAHGLLWELVANNGAFEGRVAALGNSFANLFNNSAKTYEGVLQVANSNTEFLDSMDMEECVSASDFTLSDLKMDPKGVSLFLSLPQRYMNTHNRWPRMMTGLLLVEMEKGGGKPASGHPVLVVLDEFAGMKRMDNIETGVAYMAGYGVKLFFVLQSLEQLKSIYKDRWETFLDNCGLQLYFSVGDNFTRQYVSTQMGDTEVFRDVHSTGINNSRSESESESQSKSRTRGGSSSSSESMGTSESHGQTESEGTNWSQGTSTSHSTSTSQSHSTSATNNWSGWMAEFSRRHPEMGMIFTSGSHSSSHTGTWGSSDSDSWSSSHGGSRGSSVSRTQGQSRTTGRTEGENWGETRGTTYGSTHGETRGETSGTSQTVHKRPLCAPDEVGKVFARVDDRNNQAYPGIGLALISGKPVIFHRVNYFEDSQFIGLFGPHPDHKFLPPVKYEISRDGLNKFAGLLPGLSSAPSWECVVAAGQVVQGGQTISYVDSNRDLPVVAPCAGRIVSIPMKLRPAMLSGTPSILEIAMTKNPLFNLTEFGNIILWHSARTAPMLDPFAALEAHCRRLEAERRRAAQEAAQEEARADAARQHRERQQEEKEWRAREKRRVWLRESARGWLKGGGAAGLVLAGDLAVTIATHISAAGIFVGGAAGVVTAVCGYTVARKYAERKRLAPQTIGQMTPEDYKKFFWIF